MPLLVIALTLTLLGLASLAQAGTHYRLQCAAAEVGIRWPSYFSNSEYYVCQGLYGNQLTVNCAPGEVFSFVLQQCAAPAQYVPAPPMNSLPTAAPITMQLTEDAPPVMGGLSVHAEPHVAHEEHDNQEPAVHALSTDPTPPTPPTEPPTPPTVHVADAPKPGKRPQVPVPSAQKTSGSAKKTPVPVPAKAATAKKPAAPAPAKAAKKPTPPSKAQKKPAQA